VRNEVARLLEERVVGGCLGSAVSAAVEDLDRPRNLEVRPVAGADRANDDGVERRDPRALRAYGRVPGRGALKHVVWERKVFHGPRIGAVARVVTAGVA